MIVAFTISLIGLFMLFVNCILYNRKVERKDGPYTILRYYLVALFLVELCCHVIGIMKPNSNLFLSHYYFVFQFIFLSLFFYQIYSKPKLKAMVLGLLVVVLAFLAYQYYNNPALYWIFNVYEIAITTILLILYASIFIAKFHNQYFYFCFGLISYLACSSFIFISGNTDLILMEEPVFIDIWVFNSLFYIFFQWMIFQEWKTLKAENTEKMTFV